MSSLPTLSQWARFFGVTEQQARQWASSTKLSNVSPAPPKPLSQPIFKRKPHDEKKKEKR